MQRPFTAIIPPEQLSRGFSQRWDSAFQRVPRGQTQRPFTS
jgi:hypothetical protein